ncbi:MAG: hypothetical protein HYW48_01520 [Deltaproteobacteria bacterium]|nr:hypothetical protein [Deltaproteobacteria bacterium]
MEEPAAQFPPNHLLAPFHNPNHLLAIRSELPCHKKRVTLKTHDSLMN